MFENKKHKNKIIQIRTANPSSAAGWCCRTEHPLVLSTINQGLQFAVKTPLFNSVLKSAQILEEDIASLLSKRAIWIVLLGDSHRSFYSWYFVIPKKVGGLCPILDLWNLKKKKKHPRKYKFKMPMLSII